jgi:hypothetical protein
MAGNVRLWQRDVNIIREGERSAMLASQIARLQGFPSAKKGTERLSLLHKAGVMKRMPYFQPAKQGKPEFLYYTGARPHPRTLPHTIAEAELRVQVAEWLRSTQGYAAEFYYAHEIQTSSGVIPDATLVLSKAEKIGLFFFEVDNGTESVTSTAGYSLASKLESYASYFDSEGYRRDFERLGVFRGFRVALIVPSGRLPHVQRLVGQANHDFVLVSTFDLLKQGLHRPVWVTLDGTTVDLLGRGEVIGDVMGEKVAPAIPFTASANVRSVNDLTGDGQVRKPVVPQAEEEPVIVNARERNDGRD